MKLIENIVHTSVTVISHNFLLYNVDFPHSLNKKHRYMENIEMHKDEQSMAPRFR